MSGGHFDYRQQDITSIADSIQTEIYHPSETWPEDVLEHFKDAVKYLRIAYVYSQRVDWLISGDDSVDSFKKRLAHDLHELKEKYGPL